MYEEEIIHFSGAGRLVPNPWCIAKIHKKKLKTLRDQSAIQDSEKEHELQGQWLMAAEAFLSFLGTWTDDTSASRAFSYGHITER